LSTEKKVEKSLNCYHCGDVCPDDSVRIDDKLFCCNGCKTVFEILDENNLCNYYKLDATPGTTPSLLYSTKFDYLDDHQTILQIIDFTEGDVTNVTFDIPQMHCSSCIWLLENLYKLNYAITNSQVDFLKKKLTISLNNKKISLKELVELLTSIGYEPQILLDSEDGKPERKTRKKLYYRVGVAGFCFINIMMLSFPEYLGIDLSDAFLKRFFLFLNLGLSLIPP